MRLRIIDDLLAEAAGTAHRDDPVRPGTGGPAGNARLTAWTGLVLLGLFLAELVTLIDVGTFIAWHVVIGVLLIPPALLKTGSTGWRIVRYYTGERHYRQAGPPPMILRALGPLVVVTTLAVLASGLTLVLVSPRTAEHPLFRVPGLAVSPLVIHQGSFVVWAVVTGVHTLARIVPALRLAAGGGRPRAGRGGTGPDVPGTPVAGRTGRLAALTVTAAVAIVAATLAASLAGPWRADERKHRLRHRHHRPVAAGFLDRAGTGYRTSPAAGRGDDAGDRAGAGG